MGSISVVDRDGVIRHSTRPEIIGQSRRDDYIVRAAIGAPADELIVGTPFRAIVDPGGLLIPIARRLTRDDGTVEGAVIAAFIPSELRQFFQSVDVGQRGTIWVFHADGVVLFREPSPANAIGEPAQGNAIFLAAQRAGSGTLRGPVNPDGPQLLSAFHSDPIPSLIVAVSLDRDEVLSEWRREALGSAILFAGLTLLLGATVFVLFRQMDAKTAAERALIEARRLEAEHLRHANQELAATLEREQSARRDAEAASALKDQFLMTVSHELRTPLTAIAGWANLLAAGLVGEKRKDAALRTIERNAQAQTSLIDDLLDVSRIISGQLRLDIRNVDIGEVVRNVVETLSPAATAKAIQIETSIDPRADRLAGDSERLQQIIWNLLSNAVKFTPKGGRINVNVGPAGSEVEITVSDTGIGIAPEFLPHVFERFRQQEGGTTRQYGGLGLGLAIVRHLVELHGGSVTARSEGPGKGATFVVRLPAADSPVALRRPVTPTIADAQKYAELSSVRLDNARILIVDDDKEACDLFTTILEEAGAHVTCTQNAESALHLLRHAHHDLLLSDIEMPGIDGYELVQQALAIADARGERLMTMAITAYSRPQDAARSLQAGFHRHLQKPIQPTVLLASVCSLMAIEDRDRAASPATET